MATEQVVFLILAGGILLSALMVVSVRNIVHAALFLALCFAGVAGIYVLLRAEFLAVAQVLIYIGAITVLFLFGIMLTRHITGQNIPQLVAHWKWALAGSCAFLLLLLHLIAHTEWRVVEAVPRDSTTALGLALVERYVLPFELASVILLAAVVGAVVLAKQEGR
ncbi:MAG TPA: NADH-quinone oxidoreductase subunit J [Armatimonadetes bacterium]|jgi:NADH-quinone oxidoreductase subunit J|nr:NADH-quinone oxidoreductase subunit J [Armatimonadota bacterium]